MADLKSLLENNDLKNVQTYIQSGNVVFESGLDEKSLELLIAKLIKEKYDFEVPTLVRSSKEWLEVAEHNPFLKRNPETPIEQLYVTFLSEKPTEEHLENFKALSFGKDEWILEGRTLYICYANRFNNSKLTNVPIESKLKVTASARNWKTVTHIKSMIG
jgi:uncharacterized protein (DUF1697 family)